MILAAQLYTSEKIIGNSELLKKMGLQSHHSAPALSQVQI